MSTTDRQIACQPLVVEVQAGPRKDLQLNPVAVIRQVSDSEEALSALSERIDNLDQEVANRVRFDTGNQELTDEQKANARVNIGAEEALSALSDRIDAEEQAREQADLVLQTLAETNQLNLALKADQSDLETTNEQVETNRLALLSKADQTYVNDQIAALAGTDDQLLSTVQIISQELASIEGLLDDLDQEAANHVRFDIGNQELTDEEKANARVNIGAEQAGEADRLFWLITAESIGAATSSQGEKADTALQSADVAPVALSGLFSSLANQAGIFDVVFSAYTTGANAVIAATDSLGTMLRKLQAQIVEKLNTSDAPAVVRGTALTGLSTATSAPVTVDDTVLTAAGKLQRQITDNAANSRLRFILTSTWALLPAADSVPTGTRYFVSDIGINGSDWYSDGTRWRLVNGRVTLAMSNTGIVVTGTLSATPVTVTVPPGVMGATGTLEITSLWSCPNNNNTKSCNITFGGNNYMAAALASSMSNQMLTIIRNRTVSSQVGGVGSTSWVYGPIAAPLKTTSADTSVAQNIMFNVLHSNTSDTITLESYRVDLIA